MAQQLETRLLLDGTGYAYQFQPLSSDNYGYNVGQSVTFVGEVVDTTGNVVPGVSINIHDGFEKIDRSGGTTDSNGMFSFTDSATAAGIVDTQLSGYLGSQLVAPTWMQFKVAVTGSPSEPASGLELQIGPSSGTEDPLTYAVAAKSDPLTTPAVVEDTSSVVGPVIGQFALNFLGSFLEDPINDIAILVQSPA